MPILIWWTNQADCEAIGEKLNRAGNDRFPNYIAKEYQSRYGRNGRGRLWLLAGGDDVCIEKWPKTPLGNLLAQDYGGIAIHAVDAKLFGETPGIITDVHLRRAIK